MFSYVSMCLKATDYTNFYKFILEKLNLLKMFYKKIILLQHIFLSKNKNHAKKVYYSFSIFDYY